VCIAITYANNINNQITEAKEYYNKLKIKEKVFNDVQQDLLHKIEGLDKFSLYTGWKFCMALSKLRKARRKTKNELKTMELLVKQLGGFSIKETKIDRQASHLDQLNFENGYHKRQLEMTGDILQEVDDIVNNIIYNENLTRSNANKVDVILDDNKIYEMSEKIPRVKGSNVKIRFKTQEQKKHLIHNNKPKYESYFENNTEKYVEFISRKTNK
jgi:lipopolysaccharide export LptBFGC system permease protein LptF